MPVSRPVVARLWIAAAERALDAELVDVPPDDVTEVRSQLRVAAVTAEDLMNLVAGPRGVARSSAIATLVDRFGDDAADVDHVGAAFIEEAVESTRAGLGYADAEQVAAHCAAAALDAGAAIDALSAG